MDLSEVSKLDAPAKVLKLSEAVRKFGYEDPHSPWKCVLAKAYDGVTGSRGTHRETGLFYDQRASKLFNVPMHVCNKAEGMCFSQKPASEIADYLDSLGY